MSAATRLRISNGLSVPVFSLNFVAHRNNFIPRVNSHAPASQSTLDAARSIFLVSTSDPGPTSLFTMLSVQTMNAGTNIMSMAQITF